MELLKMNKKLFGKRGLGTGSKYIESLHIKHDATVFTLETTCGMVHHFTEDEVENIVDMRDGCKTNGIVLSGGEVILCEHYVAADIKRVLDIKKSVEYDDMFDVDSYMAISDIDLCPETAAVKIELSIPDFMQILFPKLTHRIVNLEWDNIVYIKEGATNNIKRIHLKNTFDNDGEEVDMLAVDTLFLEHFEKYYEVRKNDSGK